MTMKEGWQQFVSGDGIKVLSGTRLKVTFPGGRSHKLRVSAEEDGWSLEGTIVEGFGDHPFEWMTANRSLRLCAMEMNEGNLIGTAWIPKAGMTGEEFMMIATHLAAECDRLEFQLTGEDRE